MVQDKIKKYECMSTTELLEFAKNSEEQLKTTGKSYFEPNHILEVYLYEFYDKPSDYSLIDVGIHYAYRILADRMYKDKNYQKAEGYLESSLRYNCIDMETYELYINVLYNQQKWRKMIDTAFRFYPFGYSRKDFAFFYRTIGCYALETYQAELARILYSYSNLFYKSQKADNEIQYLNEAFMNEMPSYTLVEMSDIIRKHSLPVQPKQETLAILYKTALIEKEENPDYAKVLFLSLYQLTHDEEIEKYLKEMK